MLIVKQINWSYRETVVGCFNTMRELYNHFCTVHKYNYNLASRFGFNPRDTYSKEKWVMEYETGHYRFIAPVFCMYIENEDGVRYSVELINGLFNKFYKQDNKHLYIPVNWGAKRRCRHGGSLRRPKTTQERCLAVNVIEEEGEPRWRCARNEHNLPTCWDDIAVSTYKNRNWKRYRKHQWKAK